MDIQQLRGLFEEQIRDLHSAERQTLEALPGMIEAAGDDRLRSALQDHLGETRTQKERLEAIAGELGFDPGGHHCHGMDGILKEGRELVKSETVDADVRDAAIIASAQRVEHYEMAGYGTARTLARTLGEDEAARHLQETLDEEMEADKTLTAIATSGVNREAAGEA
jgi:ferritin-like metal-binding protein YciE